MYCHFIKAHCETGQVDVKNEKKLAHSCNPSIQEDEAGG